MEQYLFPFSKLRPEQDKLIDSIQSAIRTKKNLFVHAPTGLGKTVAALGPALKEAIDNDLKVLFLTSRHTQHRIAIETLREIKEKYDLDFTSTSIIGKKWMCAQPGVQTLYSSEFAEFCKKVREDKKCEFYVNTRKSNKLTVEAKVILDRLKIQSPMDTEKLIKICENAKLCPYEMSLALAKSSKVIVADYYYLFHPNIGSNFLQKLEIDMESLIVIVDEAHNLPYRLKDLASEYLTSTSIRRGVSELKKHGYAHSIEMLSFLQDILNDLGENLRIDQEKILGKNDFDLKLTKEYDYDQIIEDLDFIGDSIRSKQKQSYAGGIARFLEAWRGQDEGFARILSYKKGLREPYYMLSYRCLDPAVVSSSILQNTYSTILMSGTLSPTDMYKQLLGDPDALDQEFEDPYPKNNRINIIIPKTTTKYSERSDAQFKEIAKVCAEIINEIPGNSAVFFPSYFIRDTVLGYFEEMSRKSIFMERSNMTKNEKQSLLERFKGYKDMGAVLLAVSAGSFGEGIDLPGDLLKGVVVVGLPLTKPDLETKSLIDYFDKKLGKGWDYGYVFPAFNKCLQSAGRCIRSETDRGAIVFLDKRFTWSNYFKCFPNDWKLKITADYKREIWEFFQN